MPTNLFHALSTAAIFNASTGGAMETLLPAALLVCAVILVVGGMRLRILQTQHTTQTQQLQQQNDTVRTMQQQMHQMRADLDDKQQEARTQRQESGTQRKKNHALQDELKRLRTSLKEETERRIAAQNTRPAFADPAPRKNLAQEATAEARSVKAAPKTPDEAKEAKAPPAPAAEQAPAVAGPSPHELAMQAQIKTLTSEVAKHQQTLRDERVAAGQVKDELKRLRKRSEDLRRIDIITKSKMEILEDKMRHLGRAHYEAISEVALLKGEVQPPRPREAPRAPSPFEAAQHLQPPDADPQSADTDDADEDFDTSAGTHDAPSVAQSAALL